MSTIAETELVERLRAAAIVPIVVLPNIEVAVPMAEALLAGGISCVEITFRTPGAHKAVEQIRAALPEMLVGAGTILDESQLSEAISAGAEFVVTPGTNAEMVQDCRRRGIPIVPGVATPSEVDLARRLGLRVLKFFPAEPLGGSNYLSTLCGPYRDVSFIPTGGLKPPVLPGYFAIPQVAACGGSWMVTPKLLQDRSFETIKQISIETRAVVDSSR